ncbi:MAG TPA: gephyrin-like molybdotransferase Glp [Verrucomicrobiae bacterium]|nr:gephyrin-like molybdotransferase Glp [Verrucomicrobiae bacterium]
MLELEEALARILAVVPTPFRETVSLDQAQGRIALDAIIAGIDLPVFDNSSMDGYAVRAADVAAASPRVPVTLRLTGLVPAGQGSSGELAAGCCVRLFTGSPMPQGADAVVMQEDTRIVPGQPEEVLVVDPVKPWENVRFCGEDMKRGTMLVQPGDRLSLGRLMLLAAEGVGQISVGRRPVVGVIATGSELKEAGEALGPGQIYESNRVGLALLVQRAGGIARTYPLVPDVPEAAREALDRAFAECDLVVSCGGVSVGEMDFTKSAFEQLGGKIQFWKVAIKPGKPFSFGRLADKFLFGLPGNPISAVVTFLVLVRPALERWQGAGAIELPGSPGVLAEPLANPGGRRHFVRVCMDAQGNVRSAGVQASHTLSSLLSANGLVDVPARTTLGQGTTVRVLRWE